MANPSIRFSEFTDDYEERPLSDFLEENKERNKKKQYSKEDVKSVSGDFGVVNQIEFFGKSMAGADVSNYHVVKHNDIVYTKSPLKANPYGIIKCNTGTAGIVSTLYAVYSCNNEVIPEYVDYYFGYDKRTNQYLLPLVNIGAKHDMKVNNQDAISGNVAFPSVEEQQRIVNSLVIHDKRISNQLSLIKNLETRRNGILQKIFSLEIRFKDDNGNNFPKWEPFAMSDLFDERNSKAKGGEELLSVTIANGVIRQSESDKRDNSSEDKSNYKQVMKGDMAYNTMRMWQGAVGVSYWDGIVSPAYTIITPKRDVNAEFLLLLFKTYNALKLFTIYSQGMSSDQWNLKFEIFSDLEFDVPSPKEQAKIVALFKLLDKQIKIEKEKLEAIKLVKKGLLQQMFV